VPASAPPLSTSGTNAFGRHKNVTNVEADVEAAVVWSDATNDPGSRTKYAQSSVPVPALHAVADARRAGRRTGDFGLDADATALAGTPLAGTPAPAAR
jgi:hypothetical protein